MARLNKSLSIQKSKNFISQNDNNLSSKETKYIILELNREPIGSINSEL